MTDRLTPQREAEIDARAGHLYEYSTRHDSEWDALAGEDVPALLAELAAVRAELAQARESVDFLERNTLPDLRRQIQHHQDGKARWRERAEKAEARVAELEALTPAPIQTCRVCGAGYAYGQPCSACEFNARMAAETGGAS